MRRFLFLFVLSVLLFWASPAAGQAPSPKLYVCNQGEATISVIDMASRTVETTVDLKERGFSKNAKPHHVVAEPDGSYWYVTLIGANTILKFNRENEIVDRARNFEVPGLLAFDPVKDTLYAGRSLTAVKPPKSVGIIERSTMDVVGRVNTFFPRPHPLTITSNGRYAFVASLATNQVMGFNTNTQRKQLTRLGGETTQTLVQFAVTQDGSTLIGGGQKTGQLLFFDASRAPALSVTDTLQVGKKPWHPVIDRNSGLAYVPNKGSNSISVVDVDDVSVQATIRGEGIAQPHGTALSANGEFLFVTNNNRNETYEPTGDNPNAGTVTVIDTDTNEIVKIIEVGTYPTGIGTFGGRQVVTP